jgi:hypothetical protein
MVPWCDDCKSVETRCACESKKLELRCARECLFDELDEVKTGIQCFVDHFQPNLKTQSRLTGASAREAMTMLADLMPLVTQVMIDAVRVSCMHDRFNPDLHYDKEKSKGKCPDCLSVLTKVENKDKDITQ